jgi:hypothetical protein
VNVDVLIDELIRTAGAVMWDHLIDCPFTIFNTTCGPNYFPKNVYPPDVPRFQEQLRPMETFAVKVENDDVWVDLEQR